MAVDARRTRSWKLLPAAGPLPPISSDAVTAIGIQALYYSTMWLGIDTSSWAQLWSGVIGSFVAAVIGGLVALVVVKLSNAHQSKLAAEQREKTAITELSASADAMVRQYDSGLIEITSLMVRATAASDKWQMETDYDPLGSEIIRWPQFLATLARDCYTSESERGKGLAQEWPEFVRLATSAVELRAFALKWHTRKNEADRESAVSKLRAHRARIESGLSAQETSGVSKQAEA